MKPTPREFGEAAQSARVAAGVSLESIAERTKIALRVLSALENGEFAKLPSRTFARLFVRQYAELISERPEPWQRSFDAAWESFESSSQSHVVVEIESTRRRRIGPWLVGAALVTAALTILLVVEQRQRAVQGDAAPPTPAALVPLLAPTPLPTPSPEVVSTPTVTGANPQNLVIRTRQGRCWVEVRVFGEAPQSRLLEPESSWEVEARGREAQLLFGDAGAAGVWYLGQVHDPVGKSGVVARLRVGAAAESLVSPEPR